LQDDIDRLEPLTGVKAFPVRVKCATLPGHRHRPVVAGPRLPIAPEADPSDRDLDICFVGDNDTEREGFARWLDDPVIVIAPDG
jgi:hypothetical protein